MFCEVSILVIWIDMYMYFSLILSVFLTLLSTLSFPHSLSLYVTLCTCIFRFLSIFLKPFSFYFCPSLLLKLYFSTFSFFLSFPLPPPSLSPFIIHSFINEYTLSQKRTFVLCKVDIRIHRIQYMVIWKPVYILNIHNN